MVKRSALRRHGAKQERAEDLEPVRKKEGRKGRRLGREVRPKGKGGKGMAEAGGRAGKG